MKSAFQGVAAAALLLTLSACSNSDGNSNLGAASGNSLNEAQIDAALGPPDQGETATNEVAASNLAGDENAAANKEGNRR